MTYQRQLHGTGYDAGYVSGGQVVHLPTAEQAGALAPRQLKEIVFQNAPPEHQNNIEFRRALENASGEQLLRYYENNILAVMQVQAACYIQTTQADAYAYSMRRAADTQAATARYDVMRDAVLAGALGSNNTIVLGDYHIHDSYNTSTEERRYAYNNRKDTNYDLRDGEGTRVTNGGGFWLPILLAMLGAAAVTLSFMAIGNPSAKTIIVESAGEQAETYQVR